MITTFKRTNLNAIFWLLLLVITVLAVVPDDAETGIAIPKLTPSGFFLHILAYLITAFVGFAANHSRRFIFILLFVHGLVMEGVQYFIPYRSFNPVDAVANLCGIFIALVLFSFIQRYQK